MLSVYAIPSWHSFPTKIMAKVAVAATMARNKTYLTANSLPRGYDGLNRGASHLAAMLSVRGRAGRLARALLTEASLKSAVSASRGPRPAFVDVVATRAGAGTPSGITYWLWQGRHPGHPCGH